MRRVSTHEESFALDGVFRISRGSRTTADVIRVSIEHNGVRGQGECVPYARYGESTLSVLSQIEEITSDLQHGLERPALQKALPAGAARNAVDCALWDLQAKTQGNRAFQLAGLVPPSSVVSAYTIGIDTCAAMQKKAELNAHRPLLKVKLGSPDDIDKLKAIRTGAPDSEIIVDANEAWTEDNYLSLLPSLQSLGVTLIEQPFHADNDALLAELPRPIQICADESCHDRASLEKTQDRYDVINIKLDKTGGLTEALELKAEANRIGLGIMVGCMVGTSLAMAPAQLVAQGVDYVDLDGPLLLAEDRDPPIAFSGSVMSTADPQLWG